MELDQSPVVLSAIDEERFGVRTAKASNVSLQRLPHIMEFCRTNKVVFLIARCLARELPTVQAMERQGFSLMDTLVYFERDLVKSPMPSELPKAEIRPVRPGEENEVREIAAQAFHGYLGHYHMDPRLAPEKCDEVYADWAYSSCISRDVADEVLIAELDNGIAGFASVRLNDPETGEGVLSGVAPFARKRGIHRALMVGRMSWCLAQRAKYMVISTQLTNIFAQKNWVRLGFEPSYAYYTFHKWFD